MSEQYEGYEKGDVCGRDGCVGIIAEHDTELSCSCHIHPPCAKCTEPRQYCPECDWSAADEQDNKPVKMPTDKEIEGYKRQAEEWDRRRTLFYARYNGKEPIETLEMRTESHTHFTQIVIGVFPKGTETKSTLLPKIQGTFGGRWDRFTDTNFKYIAYTD